MFHKLSILLILGASLSTQAMEQQIAVPAANAQDEAELYQQLKTQFYNKEIAEPFWLDLPLLLKNATDDRVSEFKGLYEKLINEYGKDEFYYLIVKEFNEAKRLFAAGADSAIKAARDKRFFATRCLKILFAALPEERQTQKSQEALKLHHELDAILAKFAPKSILDLTFPNGLHMVYHSLDGWFECELGL